MSNNSSLFDVEELQQLTYERSKKWSIFLNSVYENEHEDPVHLEELDGLYEDPHEDHNELASMEDETCEDELVDTEVLKDITNSNYNGVTSSKLSDSTLVHKDTNEIVDLLNQTIPVINEHNRQMKDFGLERILNTFDAKKIEEKVGGWLKRHNSLGVSNSYDYSSNCLKYQTMTSQPMAMTKYGKHVAKDDVSDSDNSFHSGETARYIRKVGATKTASSPTTMIKTYRTIERSRQALREKYACAQDYEAELLHLKRLRHHRQYSSQTNLMRAHKMKQTVYKTPSQMISSRKRKVLRKRSTTNSFRAEDTSSDSGSSCCNGSKDTFYCRKRNCCGQYYKATLGGFGPLTSVKRYQHRGHVPAIPSSMAASAKRLHYRNAGKRTFRSCNNHANYSSSDTSSDTSSPLLSPSGPFTCQKKLIRRQNSDNKSNEFDFKHPASKEKIMCQDYKHVANTSTGEWVVEETFISKKVHIEPHAEQMENYTNFTVEDKINKDEVPLTPLTSKTTKTIKEKSSVLKKINSRKSNSSMDATDKSFEEAMKLAIEESKKMYKKELLKSQEKTSKKERKPLTTMSLANKRTLRKRHLSEDIEEVKKDNIKGKSNKTKISSDYDQNNSFVKKISTTQNSLEKTKRNSIVEDGSEETFFAASGRVCNSTALPNNKSVCKREIEGDLKLHSSFVLSDTKMEDKKCKSSSKPIKKILKSLTEDNTVKENETRRRSKTYETQRNRINNEDDNIFLKPQEKSKKRSMQKPKSKSEDGSSKEINVEEKEFSKEESNGNEKVRKSSSSKKSRNRKTLEITNEAEKQTTTKWEDEIKLVAQQNINLIQEDNIVVEQYQQKCLTTPSNKLTDNLNITSTTKNSGDLLKSPRISTSSTKRLTIDACSDDDANDCTVVSSTTNIEPKSNVLSPVVPVQQDQSSEFKKAILIYTPQNPSSNIPLSNDGCFVHISKDHLSSLIGEKPAEKFLKYYIGRRRFPKNSWVYFKPPAKKVHGTNESSSSDSDLDELDRIGKYGALYASDGTSGGAYNAALTDNEKP